MSRWLFSLAFAFLVAPVFAEPITASRIKGLSPAEQPAWLAYLDHSQALAAADAEALRGEVAANKMTEPLRAPEGGDFKLSAKTGDAWYASEEAGKLAEVILSYQTPAGGWSKHTGYNAGPRKPGMLWTSQNEPGSSPHYLGTFDNRSTTEQLHFLANKWLATQDERCRLSFIRGLKYILAAQYPNGGWPQVYPLEGDYHDDITFNDDAMTHVLELLQAIVKREPRFAFLDESRREQAAQALKRGLACVIATQVEIDGKKTVWCAQHDALSLEPSQARQLEPPTLSGVESAQLLKCLMTIPDPSTELVASIEHGLSWLESAKVVGLRRTKLDGKTVYVDDPASTEIYWARFYDLTSGKPVFPGRNGKLYDSFAAMAAENKLGYDFYSSLPGSILKNGQKKWRKMLARRE